MGLERCTVMVSPESVPEAWDEAVIMAYVPMSIFPLSRSTSAFHTSSSPAVCACAGGAAGKAGFSASVLYAVEGCIWFCPTLQEKWENPESRERLLRLVRMTDQEPSLLGISPHFLAVCQKPLS